MQIKLTMQATTPQSLFTEADQLLMVADEEINRAQEDAVTHLICHNSRQSIANYLAGYLIEKGQHVPYPATLDGLLERCKAIDGRFSEIDFSPVQCRFDKDVTKEYCLDFEEVGQCFRIAQQTQALVKSS
jgi:hypothetical protein